MAEVTILGDTYQTEVLADGKEWILTNLRFPDVDNSTEFPGSIDISYGRFYNNQVLDLTFPDGWRIPTLEEFAALFVSNGGTSALDSDFRGTISGVGPAMRSTWWDYWTEYVEPGPSDVSGFKAVGAGYLDGPLGSDIQSRRAEAKFITATPWAPQSGYVAPDPPYTNAFALVTITSLNNDVTLGTYYENVRDENPSRYSVRLVRDATPTPEPTPTEESTMSQLDAIVSVTIDRQTQSVSQQSFGIPGVIGQFLTSKTTTAFTRAREYADTAEMLADGWTTADAVYKACAAIFRQNPTVPKVIVGRKDAADADWAAALTAINNENGDWYRFVILPVVTATPNDEYLDAAEWTETQKKRLFIQTLETDTLNAALSTDLAAQLKALGYERTVVQYHLAANTDEYAHASWVGEGSPFDPGSSTWAYKTLKGVTADKLTTGQKSAAWGKNCNTYTTVGGVSITEKGVVASGEFIDILDGIDWIESRLQETVFGSLVNLRKIPYDDSGIQMIRGLVKSVLDEAGRKGILQGDTIEVTAPKYKDIPSADRMARHLPDIKFTALLQGAIHTVAISGVVSV